MSHQKWPTSLSQFIQCGSLLGEEGVKDSLPTSLQSESG